MANPQDIQGNLIQKVLPINEDGTSPINVVPIDSEGNAIGADEFQIDGTAFGDNNITAQRIPQLSGRWSQGIPARGFEVTITNTAFWQVVQLESGHNGAVECMTGTHPSALFFATSQKLNRYQDGIQSYFLGTFSFENIQNTNGDFEVLVGAMLRGLGADSTKISEGQVFGYVKTAGVLKRIFRNYKNTEITHEIEIQNEKWFTDDDNLSIFNIKLGYLGIHPFQLQAVKKHTTSKGRNYYFLYDIFDYQFAQNVTHVNDPNMAFGVRCENKGNTVSIGIRNGSINFGNIGIQRDNSDSSARRITNSFSAASIAAGSNVICTYTLPETQSMIKRIDLGGNTYDNFRITQSNRLLNVAVSGLSNKPARLEIWLVPKSLVTGATYTVLNPYFNVLQRATGLNIGNAASVYTQGTLIKSFLFNSGNLPLRVNESLRLDNFQLDNKTVAVCVVINSQAVTDYEHIFDTEDLF